MQNLLDQFVLSCAKLNWAELSRAAEMNQFLSLKVDFSTNERTNVRKHTQLAHMDVDIKYLILVKPP